MVRSMTPRGEMGPPAQVDLRHADLRGSAESCARWIRAAAGGESATVRVYVPDASGQLNLIACEGQDDGSGRLRSTRRRVALRTGRTVHLLQSGSPGLTLGIFPLTKDGHALGVVEVLAPTSEIVEREEVLLALIGQSALVLNSARMSAETEQALAAMRAMQRLATELFGARTPAEGVRATVDACFEYLGIPVAGLLPDRDGWGWFLAASGGLGTRRRSELRTALRGRSDDAELKRVPIPSLRRHFREVTACGDVVAVRAGHAVLLVGVALRAHHEFLERIGALLAAVLAKLGRGRPGSTRKQTSDFGIAWTAHELRGPLVGAGAALERAYETSIRSEEGQELVRRTQVELRQLAELIDPLLRWSTGTETLKRERADLVSIVRDAVASSLLEWDADRVAIEAPEYLFVRADVRQLRIAIANVVRNALMYSPPGTHVKVRVGSETRTARVVVRDRGPGVPTDDKELIFDPFSRGRVGRQSRPGFGLGLFIARRVLEAHGGSIFVRPDRSGATFVVELPVPNERRERSAS